MTTNADKLPASLYVHCKVSKDRKSLIVTPYFRDGIPTGEMRKRTAKDIEIKNGTLIIKNEGTMPPDESY